MDGVSINAEVTYDSSKKLYNLKINGQPYSEIPKREDFEPEPEQMIDTREKLDAHLTLNNEVIQFGCKPWEQDVLQQKIDDSLQGAAIQKILIQHLTTSPIITNELFEMIIDYREN